MAACACRSLRKKVGYLLGVCSCWVLMPWHGPGVSHGGGYFCSNISPGKSAQNNLLGHLECFRVLVCLWSCTSVYVYANMYKQVGICFKHLRAVIYPQGKFGMSRVIVPVFFLQWHKNECFLVFLQEPKQQCEEQNHWTDTGVVLTCFPS